MLHVGGENATSLSYYTGGIETSNCLADNSEIDSLLVCAQLHIDGEPGKGSTAQERLDP
jgi:hypothetical protein